MSLVAVGSETGERSWQESRRAGRQHTAMSNEPLASKHTLPGTGSQSGPCDMPHIAVLTFTNVVLARPLAHSSAASRHRSIAAFPAIHRRGIKRC